LLGRHGNGGSKQAAELRACGRTSAQALSCTSCGRTVDAAPGHLRAPFGRSSLTVSDRLFEPEAAVGASQRTRV
jgi:hypothetical protein